MTPNVVSVLESDFYEDIVAKLVDHDISGVPVVNAAHRVVGIISEKDLVRPIFPSETDFYDDPSYFMDQETLVKEAAKVKKLRARDLMSKSIITINADEHVLSACALLIYKKIRRLPVVENGKLVGIVTTKNLFKKYLQKVVK